jgi:hypothetical protein
MIIVMFPHRREHPIASMPTSVGSILERSVPISLSPTDSSASTRSRIPTCWNEMIHVADKDIV